jgi:hypothetical protein
MEEIRADAVVCKHCRSRVTGQAAAHGGVCPYCREDINPEATRCKHCGSDFVEREPSGARGGCGCCGGVVSGPFAGPQTVAFRNQFGGQCYNRCMLYCSGDPGWCSLVCSFICEGAPVGGGTIPQTILQR